MGAKMIQVLDNF